MKPPPYPRLTGDEPCRDNPDAWFPSSPNSAGAALAACKRCPIREACFTWAVNHTVEGVWGGSTENERKAYQRRHHIVPVHIPTGPTLMPINVLRQLDRGASTEDVARHYGVTADVIDGIAARRRRA